MFDWRLTTARGVKTVKEKDGMPLVTWDESGVPDLIGRRRLEQIENIENIPSQLVDKALWLQWATLGQARANHSASIQYGMWEMNLGLLGSYSTQKKSNLTAESRPAGRCVTV